MNAILKQRQIPENSRSVRRSEVNAVVYVYEMPDGKPVAVAYKGKAVKWAFWYRFPSAERRDAYVSEWLESIDKAQSAKSEKKAAEKAHREAMKKQGHGVKVGDIFHYAWGYDQTQCEFYQVIEVKPASIVVREIESSVVPSQYAKASDMSCQMVAVKDAFVAEDGYRGHSMVKVAKYYAGDDEPHFAMDYGGLYRWDGKPKYCSWYA